MAKRGLEYFPLDIDMFQDIRIRKLIKYKGGDAVTVYTVLLCLIYKDGYYMTWDDELPFVISEFTGLDERHVTDVINCCLEIGLFHKELFDRERVLTSRAIQIRYCNIKRLKKRLARIDEHRLIDLPESPSPAAAPRPSRASAGLSEVPQSSAVESEAEEDPGVEKVNASYLAQFFGTRRTESLNKLCRSLGFPKPDFPRLRSLAEEIVAEWDLAETEHTDFSDWSRHLISLLRIRASDAGKSLPAPDGKHSGKTEADREAARRARSEEWERRQKTSSSAAEYIRSLGYDPSTVTLVQAMSPEWRSKNPPSLPFLKPSPPPAPAKPRKPE